VGDDRAYASGQRVNPWQTLELRNGVADASGGEGLGDRPAAVRPGSVSPGAGSLGPEPLGDGASRETGVALFAL